MRLPAVKFSNGKLAGTWPIANVDMLMLKKKLMPG